MLRKFTKLQKQVAPCSVRMPRVPFDFRAWAEPWAPALPRGSQDISYRRDAMRRDATSSWDVWRWPWGRHSAEWRSWRLIFSSMRLLLCARSTDPDSTDLRAVRGPNRWPGLGAMRPSTPGWCLCGLINKRCSVCLSAGVLCLQKYSRDLNSICSRLPAIVSTHSMKHKEQ
jgi:hypothetical protein